MGPSPRKLSGSYYTPEKVVACLLKWVLREDKDRLLDPSCGDGRFVAGHQNSVGVEQDIVAVREAIARAPWALIHEGDFFSWASSTRERFDCAAGNPPFIRYQTFNGAVRKQALELCSRAGVNFSSLTSSWAPFLVAAASLLKPEGRIAFVVPAEIGHATYAAPLLEYLTQNFGVVHIVAIREKLFPTLSEDCWLLYAEGFGKKTAEIRFSALDRFSMTSKPPASFARISVSEWRDTWNRRLRPYFLPAVLRDLYQQYTALSGTYRFGDIANIGIGYVSGANEFFHLRPSVAKHLNIPKVFLHPTVRKGRVLQSKEIGPATVAQWLRSDEQVLLLRLPKEGKPIGSVQRYLDTDEGRSARKGYKCRMREPWYSVPDVQVPDLFLSYMSGLSPSLVRNGAGCTCTNSVHSVRIRDRRKIASLQERWNTEFVQLSCEIEGHPLGGGMLKLEPREASRIVLPSPAVICKRSKSLIGEGISSMREWRHYAN